MVDQEEYPGVALEVAWVDHASWDFPCLKAGLRESRVRDLAAEGDHPSEEVEAAYSSVVPWARALQEGARQENRFFNVTARDNEMHIVHR